MPTACKLRTPRHRLCDLSQLPQNGSGPHSLPVALPRFSQCSLKWFLSTVPRLGLVLTVRTSKPVLSPILTRERIGPSTTERSAAFTE